MRENKLNRGLRVERVRLRAVGGRPVVQEGHGPHALPAGVGGALLRHLRRRVAAVRLVARVADGPRAVEVGVARPHGRRPVVVQLVQVVGLVQRLDRRLLVRGVGVAIALPVAGLRRHQVAVGGRAVVVVRQRLDRRRAVRAVQYLMIYFIKIAQR